MWHPRASAATIDGSSYDLWAPGVWGPVEEVMFDAVKDIGRANASGGDPNRGAAGKIAGQSMVLRDQLAPFGDFDSPVPYPDPGHRFSESMSALAAMIAAGLPLQCVSVTAPGGYDTHDNQESSFGNDIGLTFDTLAAFQADLEARGLAHRVFTLIYSEFGRCPEENSTGTDHGAGGAAFLMGSRARGEMIGEFPGLAQLDEDDNLRHTSDFRGVYCSLLEQWFGVDAGQIIPGASGFGRPALVQ